VIGSARFISSPFDDSSHPKKNNNLNYPFSQ